MSTQEWIDAIYKRLQEATQKDESAVLIAYESVSKAFPNGPHEVYSGLNKIDFHALTIWSNGVGFESKADHESTHLKQQSIPWIKFSKK